MVQDHYWAGDIEPMGTVPQEDIGQEGTAGSAVVVGEVVVPADTGHQGDFVEVIPAVGGFVEEVLVGQVPVGMGCSEVPADNVGQWKSIAWEVLLGVVLADTVLTDDLSADKLKFVLLPTCWFDIAPLVILHLNSSEQTGPVGAVVPDTVPGGTAAEMVQAGYVPEGIPSAVDLVKTEGPLNDHCPAASDTFDQSEAAERGALVSQERVVQSSVLGLLCHAVLHNSKRKSYGDLLSLVALLPP